MVAKTPFPVKQYGRECVPNPETLKGNTRKLYLKLLSKKKRLTS
jgi:hypothetical protein